MPMGLYGALWGGYEAVWGPYGLYGTMALYGVALGLYGALWGGYGAFRGRGLHSWRRGLLSLGAWPMNIEWAWPTEYGGVAMCPSVGVAYTLGSVAR